MVLLRGRLDAIDPVTGETAVLHGDAPASEGVGTGPDGGLWTVYTGPLPGTFPPPQGRVYRMNLATGEVTRVGGTGVYQGLAIAPPEGGVCLASGGALAIPTLSPLALLALAAALAVAAFVVIRRVG